MSRTELIRWAPLEVWRYILTFLDVTSWGRCSLALSGREDVLGMRTSEATTSAQKRYTITIVDPNYNRKSRLPGSPNIWTQTIHLLPGKMTRTLSKKVYIDLIDYIRIGDTFEKRNYQSIKGYLRLQQLKVYYPDGWCYMERYDESGAPQKCGTLNEKGVRVGKWCEYTGLDLIRHILIWYVEGEVVAKLYMSTDSSSQLTTHSSKIDYTYGKRDQRLPVSGKKGLNILFYPGGNTYQRMDKKGVPIFTFEGRCHGRFKVFRSSRGVERYYKNRPFHLLP